MAGAGTGLLSGLRLRPTTPQDHEHNLRVLLSFLLRLVPGGALQVPVMTSTERDAIASPADGMLIYNSTTTQIEAREAGAWVP